MSLPERVACDEIRGVAGYHSRVPFGSEAELDRLHHAEGVRVPWLPDQDAEEEQEERLAVRIIREFCHFFIHMRPRELRIFHARLQGFEWQEIADAVIGDCSAQAAQNEFRKTLERFPALNRVFQERQPNKTKEHDA